METRHDPRDQGGRIRTRLYKWRFEKREPLGKVSSLGLYTLSINKIDLSNLIGGSPLIVPCTLIKNRIGIDIDILADTRANGFVFINTTLANQLYKGLGLKLTLLVCTIQAKGYNKHNRQAASYYLNINLIVEGYCQYNILFIVLNLRVYKIILGCI